MLYTVRVDVRGAIPQMNLPEHQASSLASFTVWCFWLISGSTCTVVVNDATLELAQRTLACRSRHTKARALWAPGFMISRKLRLSVQQVDRHEDSRAGACFEQELLLVGRE